MKNFVVIVGLSILYFVFCFLREQAPFFFLVVTPIIIGIAGYELIKGQPLIKRILAGIIPMIALVWMLIFLDVEKIFRVAIIHAMVIGLIVVQVWEIFRGCLSMAKRGLIDLNILKRE